MNNQPGTRITISGVPLRIAPSLGVLVAGLLAVFWLRLAPTTPVVLTVIMAVVGATAVLASTLWHELAHARAATKRGVPVADITLLAVGGVTQLDTAPATAKHDAAIAASGPWASLVIGAVAGLVATVIPVLSSHMVAVAAADVAGVLAWWNVALAVFNALPGAPLDGGRIIRAAVWHATGSRLTGAKVAAHAGQVLATVLAAAGVLLWFVSPLPRTLAVVIGAAFVVTAASIGRGATRELALIARADQLPAAPNRPVRTDLIDRIRFSVAVAIVTTASLIVPLPVVEVSPAPLRPIIPLIAVDDTAVSYDTDGEIFMLIVTRGQRATLPALIAAVDPRRSLVPVEQVFPAGTDRDQLRNVNLARFARQFDIAVAVGARYVGVDTEIVSEVVVIHVQLDGAADGTLRPGDTILAVNNVEMFDAASVQDAIRNNPADTPLTVTARRAGQINDYVLTPRFNPNRDVYELGIAVDTALESLRLPFRISLAEELRIGGPSAGLAVGLAVVERLTETSVFAGRRIAATGTLDINGIVGAVGDIPEKLQAAKRGGADVVFVPNVQRDLAELHAPAGLTVVGVDTLDEAVTYLTRNP